MSAKKLGVVAVVVAMVRATHAPAAPGDDGVRWREQWPRARASEIVATELLLAGSLVLARARPTPLLRTRGGVLLDDPIRATLRLRSPEARAAAREVSDVLMIGMVSYPLAVDGLAVAGMGHGKTDVLVQTGLIDLQSFALTAALTATSKSVVGRERPRSEGCGGGRRTGCRDGARRSFFSGHAAMAATGAGLVCVHHEHLPLYGGGAGDDLACAGGLAVALTVGALRVVSDEHYASDVVAGTVVGLVSGYLVPRVLHYRGGIGEPETATAGAPLGVGYAGAF